MGVNSFDIISLYYYEAVEKLNFQLMDLAVFKLEYALAWKTAFLSM